MQTPAHTPAQTPLQTSAPAVAGAVVPAATRGPAQAATPTAAAPIPTNRGPQPVPTPAPLLADDSLSPDEAPYRILIVEDDRAQALFAQSVLHGAGMEATVLSAGEGVQHAIESERPDLILMDLHLPDLDGMRLTSMIRQMPGQQTLPIVFLSGDPDPERQFEVLDSGADDFLTKPIRPRHLIAAVSNRIRRARQQQRSGAPASGPALNNPETGLPTRHNLMQQLAAALSSKEGGGLLFIEIAGALGLRERFGYALFERLMVQAGQHLADSARPNMLARLNDNSFLVLARDIDEAGIGALAARLRQSLANRTFVLRDEENVHLRASIGHAALDAGFEDGGQVLEAVEQAAIQARLLPDGISAHVPRTGDASDEHLALLEGHLELAYQPIVAVAGGETAQYQVLLRLRQQDGTLLSAGQVIPAAEAAGRIADLDQQVIDHALGLIETYRHATPPLHLFVSQSLRTLARDVFADWLANELRTRSLVGNELVIDVRLPDVLIHAATLQQFCSRLASTGVRFCVSQFEPTPEAIALLGQLPLAFVRLAGRYANAHTHQKTRDELHVAIEAAHKAGIQVIGQQIEDPQAAAAMWVGGIDFIQGNMVQSAGSELNFDFHNAVL